MMMHGAPCSGKTSVKNLIMMQSLRSVKKEHDNDDPLRNISIIRMIYNGKKLEELNEEKFIRMIGKELHSHIQQDDTGIQNQLHSLFIGSSSTPSEMQVEMPGIFNDIAKNLDSVDSTIPKLFECKFIEFVDSGGQPQFTDVLPLVFRSRWDHHIVVLRLDQNLNDNPKSTTRKVGKQEYSEHVRWTNFQLIERVCQLAKSSESKVIVVGTHPDVGNKEESLEKKNEQLEVLEKKYPDTLVKNDEGFIVTVNAKLANDGGDDLNAKNLHDLIFTSEFLQNVDGENAFVSLCGILFELELKRRSRGGMITIEEFYTVAKSLGIKSDNMMQEVLDFLKKFAGYNYYPNALPEVIFTSASPILYQLYNIIHHSFSTKTSTCKRLSCSGRLKKKSFFDLYNKTKFNELLPSDNFLRLMKHLYIIFEIDESMLFIPNLLSETQGEDNSFKHFHNEPLVLFLQNEEDDEELMMLPQPFFQALIIDLLCEECIQLPRTQHSRSSVTLKFILNGKEHMLRFVNRVCWLEIFAHRLDFSNDMCPFLFETIQNCAKSLLAHMHHGIQVCKFGLRCFCKEEPFHPCAPPAATNDNYVFTCFFDEVKKQQISDSGKFWFEHLGQ